MGEDQRPGVDQGATDPGTDQRLTVSEAAAHMGISEDAVRSRIKRGTLKPDREGGRVFVVLGRSDRPTDRPGESGTLRSEDRTADLIAELQDRVRSLEEANRENRRIIAALTSRIPAIEPPSDERDAPEAASEDADGVRDRSDATGPQTGAERRPWWRRIIGG